MLARSHMEVETDIDRTDERTPLLIHNGLSAEPNGVTHRLPNAVLTSSDARQADGEIVIVARLSQGSKMPSDTNGHWITASGQYGEHCHVQTQQDAARNKSARCKLIIASIVCMCFMVGEAIGGIIANSLAIATDAAHLLTDLTSFLISLVSMYIALRPATKRMSFGWYRAEVIGALVSVLLIWIVTAALVYLAVLRVVSQTYEIDAQTMLIMAALSVVFNICMGIILHDTGHGHSHGGSRSGRKRNISSQSQDISNRPSQSVPNGQHAGTHLALSENNSSRGVTVEPIQGMEEARNINVKAAFIHVLGDLLQSFGVLSAAFIIYYKPEWKLADPICTFVFSVLVLITTISILRDIFSVLMEAVPCDISFHEIREGLCSLEGVRELHDLRLWSLTTTRAALSVHLAIDSTVDTQQLLAAANAMVRERFGIYECTFQMEHYVSEMGDCAHCKEPSD